MKSAYQIIRRPVITEKGLAIKAGEKMPEYAQNL